MERDMERFAKILNRYFMCTVLERERGGERKNQHQEPERQRKREKREACRYIEIELT
jgi:hypothetical protein